MSSAVQEKSARILGGTDNPFYGRGLGVERIKSQILMKRNLKALIRHRGKTAGGLARFLRRKGHDDKDADSWMSHILDESDLKRELPMEMWDRAAEYLAVDTYHFFLPGIANNEITERRSGTDRRQRNDRRLGQDLPSREREVDLMGVIRLLPPDALEEAIRAVMKILDGAVLRRRAKPGSAGGHENTSGTDAPTHAPKRGRHSG